MIRNRLYLVLAFFMLINFSSNAQDLGMSRLSYPEDNMRVHLQFSYPLDFVLKNFGNSAQASGTAITFGVYFDGVLQQNLTWTNPSNIKAGDSIQLTTENAPILYSFSTPNPTIEVCVISSYTGNPNLNNDSACNTLYFSIDNNIDLAPYFLDITIPDIDSVLDPGEIIIKMQARIQNTGTVTLPRSYKIETETKVDNNPKTIKYTLSTSLDTSESYLLDMIIGQPAPTKNGPFDICITLINNPDDQDASNDQYCKVFYAYDWTGISDITSAEPSSFSAEGNLHLKDFNQELIEVQIYNVSGQQVMRRLINSPDGKGSFDISNLNSGIYILKAMQKGEVVHTDKFTID